MKMKKKILLSAATAAALVFSSPALDKAEAANHQYEQTKVYYYQAGNLNAESINKFLQNYFKNYQFQWSNKQDVEQPVKQPEQQPAAQPTTPTNQQQTPEQKPAEQSAEYQLNAYEQEVINLTNQERAKHGLAPLKVDTALSKVAREKSLDMQRNQYFSHNSPTYGSPFDMMKQFGVSYKAAGENIAMGQRSPAEVVQAWMNSEGHRKNILSSSFTHIGVGYVESGNYWTQQFIGK